MRPSGFFPEPETDAANRLLMDEGPILAPDLVVAELSNVGWKRFMAGEIDADGIRMLAANLSSFFDAFVPMVRLAPRAIQVAAELRHPVHDCFYVALAESEACPLVTADRRLAARAKGTHWARIVRPLGR